jgi:hypothetical protein
MTAKEPLREVVSRSTRRMRASGKRSARGFLHPLRALAGGAQIQAAAFRAGFRRSGGEAAVVADQAVAGLVAMQDQMGGTARAGKHVAATVAQHGGRVAAPVDEHQALLAPLQAFAQASQQGGGEALAGPVGAAVHQADGGQRRLLVGAPGQAEQPVAPGPGVAPGFQGRGGGAEHHRHVALTAAPDRHVPGGIAHAFHLLVGAVVFLVHHDEPQPGQGREHRQAGAEHDVGAAFQGVQPGGAPFPVGQAAVQADQLVSRETPDEAFHELGGEVDFRHQHQGLPLTRQDVRHQSQIDLGLAAAGDAVQQPGREARRRGSQGVQRAGLFPGQFRAGKHPARARHQGGRGDGRHPPPPQPVAHQGLLPIRQIGPVHDPPPQPLHQGDPGRGAGGQARRLGLSGLRQPIGRGRLRPPGRRGAAQGRRQQGGQHRAHGMMVVIGDEAGQRQQIRRQGRRVSVDRAQGLEACRGQIGSLRQFQQHANPVARPERHLDAPADVGLGSIPGQVVEQPVQRRIQGDPGDPLRW